MRVSHDVVEKTPGTNFQSIPLIRLHHQLSCEFSECLDSRYEQQQGNSKLRRCACPKEDALIPRTRPYGPSRETAPKRCGHCKCMTRAVRPSPGNGRVSKSTPTGQGEGVGSNLEKLEEAGLLVDEDRYPAVISACVGIVTRRTRRQILSSAKCEAKPDLGCPSYGLSVSQRRKRASL